MTTNTLNIRLRRLDEIKFLPGNAKLHDIEEIKSSIRAHGFLDPIGVNPETDHDVDGNGRLEALKAIYAENQGGNAPKFIVVKQEPTESGGRKKVPVWYVPTVDLPFDRETEGIVALRLNRSAQKAGFDERAVFEVLAQAAAFDRLDETGFDQQYFDQLAEEFAEPPEFNDPLPDTGPTVTPWTATSAAASSRPAVAQQSLPAEPETPAAAPPPPPSHVRMVQLYFNDQTHAAFTDRCARLMASGVTNDDGTPVRNVTDLVLAVVRDAEARITQNAE